MTGDAKSVANVGWGANGYINLGNAGLVVYAALVAGLLRMIDIWNQRMSGDAILSAFSISLMNIFSVDLTVARMGTGLLFMIIQLSVLFRLAGSGYRRRKREKSNWSLSSRR